MFEKFVEQTQSAFKPMSEIMALNVKAMEQLVDKQSTLLTGVMNDGVTYAKDVVAQKDIAGVYQAQKNYMEGVQEKMVSVTKDVYSVMTEAQEKMGDVMKGAVTEVKPVATPAKSAK
ncbi:phasin family protein [Exilibacterium tricleocarpae]|uniref:Phasin family protein n=1 Tax=Exilibacterium tricleocarpae TaxID=2591008 RepID=A0A545SMC5_9GAMM|nr:phasin family protein [Exilibacterium tricleocarpae]TQV66138.1 phasin family protein [Exilibacterium tricleocarpae]